MTDRIKFYMDEHVAKSVTEGLRRRGVDVVTVQELGLQAAEDQQHLQRAAQEGRVVVDAGYGLSSAARRQGLSWGHCVRSSADTGSHMLRALMLVHDVLTAEDMIQNVEFL